MTPPRTDCKYSRSVQGSAPTLLYIEQRCIRAHDPQPRKETDGILRIIAKHNCDELTAARLSKKRKRR